MRKIFSDGLTPENSSYWSTFVTLTLAGKDPRRAWPLVEWLASFRLDMKTNAAFKESSKITLLQLLVHNKATHRMHTIKPKHRRLMLKPKPNSRPR